MTDVMVITMQEKTIHSNEAKLTRNLIKKVNRKSRMEEEARGKHLERRSQSEDYIVFKCSGVNS